MSEADRDRSHFDAMQELETELMSALAQGIFETTLTLPTLAWISIVDEIKNRRPRNYSQLLRDDQVERLEAAIERLHDEANFLIANGPAAISTRQGSQRPTKRSVISDELKRQLRDSQP